VPQENLLVVVDDIALPVGTLRMKKQGSGGGHNGLGNIEQLLGGSNYCRLRVGVGSNFSRGHQIDYVLGAFDDDELAVLQPKIETACEAVKCFVTQGPDRAMNMYNTKG
jgi:PTH1 family peptidyl-tRNA hydrolase